MKAAVLVLSFLPAILGGCASTETVKEARGQGVTRVYRYPYAPAYAATLAAANAKEPEVVVESRRCGLLDVPEAAPSRAIAMNTLATPRSFEALNADLGAWVFRADHRCRQDLPSLLSSLPAKAAVPGRWRFL